MTANTTRQRRYLALIEAAEGENSSAYAPDLPGCVTTGPTLEECRREMRDAIAFHIEGVGKAGQPVPEPSMLTAASIDVDA